ncbi:MAG: transcriptional repressor NrdR [Gemmatimonadetes bacterium]|nr:transcriptional repressor NrdR [Gemmatimonadota bacterium]
MRCPFCGTERDRVVDTRSSKEGRAIRRRRECLACGKRFTTYEAIELVPLQVVKLDGRREPYDRQKLLLGMVTACTKRPVNLETIEAAVDRIEEKLEEQLEGSQSRRGASEIEGAWLGERVMEELEEIDPVAYVRFASVYRKFQDVTEFMDELKGLSGGEE